MDEERWAATGNTQQASRPSTPWLRRRRYGAGSALALVLLVVVVLRFWAIGWGAPYLYHPDEHLVLHPALNIVRTGDVNPRWFQYPSLLIYLQAGLVAAVAPFLHAPLTTDPAQNHTGPWDALPAQWPFALAGRCVVAGFAVLGTYWIYRLGRGYAGTPVGLAAALFLAAAPLHNESSHFLTTDVPAATLLTAALALSVDTVRAPRVRRLLLSGCVAGLAAATKYTAGMAVLVPLAVAFSFSSSRRLHAVVAVVAAAAVGFLVACPFAALDFPAFWSGIVQQRQNYLGGYSAGPNWRWYALYLYSLGLRPPLAVAATLGLLLIAIRSLRHADLRRLNLTLAMVPILYFVVVSSYPSRAERNLIILLPFLCLFAADAVWRIAQAARPRRGTGALCALLVAAIAIPGIVACVQHDRELTRPDTRTVALRWIETHLPPGSRIAREEYTPQISGERYRVTYQWSLAQHDYGWYLAQPIDYLVVSANVYSRALYPPYLAGPAGPRFYTFIFQKLPLAAEFNPSPEMSGPTIRIYTVPHAGADGS